MGSSIWYEIGPVQQKKKRRKIVIIFLSISLKMCIGCSKEPSHRDHMFWLRNKKNIFSYTILSGGLYDTINMEWFIVDIQESQFIIWRRVWEWNNFMQ